MNLALILLAIMYFHSVSIQLGNITLKIDVI